MKSFAGRAKKGGILCVWVSRLVLGWLGFGLIATRLVLRWLLASFNCITKFVAPYGGMSDEITNGQWM
jgi:hypothetical protein